MNDLNQRLSCWASATELQQLSGTEMQLEDWRKYMGRCRLPEVSYQHPDLGYLNEFGDEGCRKAWLWWAATNKILRVATAGWTMKTGEELQKRAREILQNQVSVKGTETEKAAWILLLHTRWDP